MEKNGVITRLKEFADSKGGFKVLADRIGKSKEMFYNLVSRDAMPAGATMEELASAFPDMDLNYIFRGIKTETKGEKLVEELKIELDIQKAVVARLVGKPETITKSLLVDNELESELASELLIPGQRIILAIDPWSIALLKSTYGEFPSVLSN